MPDMMIDDRVENLVMNFKKMTLFSEGKVHQSVTGMLLVNFSMELRRTGGAHSGR